MIKSFLKTFFLNSDCIICHSKRIEPFYHICYECQNDLILTKNIKNLCTYCHDSWIVSGVCQNCNNQQPIWNKLHTIFSYQGAIKKIFHLYKFRDSVLAEKDLIKLLTPYIEKFSEYHFLIVPCSKNTKNRLGHNPVTHIIKQITSNYSEPFINNSTKNMKTLDRTTRKSTTGNIEFHPKIDYQNKKILLIDDIFTTGSTLEMISKILIQHKINNFEALCFFRS